MELQVILKEQREINDYVRNWIRHIGFEPQSLLDHIQNVGERRLVKKKKEQLQKDQQFQDNMLNWNYNGPS